jgi:hypothetical protein
MERINYFATHIVAAEDFPQKGMRKLFFYTVTAESHQKGRYYWGTGNNVYEEQYIQELETSKKIIKLPKEIPLEQNKGFWVDYEGKVYYADLKEPYKDRDFIFIPKQFSIVTRSYMSDIGQDKVPKTYISMNINF